MVLSAKKARKYRKARNKTMISTSVRARFSTLLDISRSRVVDVRKSQQFGAHTLKGVAVEV